MPVATRQPEGMAQEGRDQQSPALWNEPAKQETPSAGYLPAPAWRFAITDPEHWIDLCA